MKLKSTPLAALAGIALAAAAAFAAEPQKSHDAAVARNLNIFSELVRQLELNYVDSIRTDDAFEAAIGAMLETVDPYTEYYTGEEVDQLQTMTTGEYGGIGSYILTRGEWTYISEPYEGSPAAEAGLRAGDRIVRIDSLSARGMKSADVSKNLKGVPGTPVTIVIERPYTADSVMTVTLERRKLQMPSVPYYGVHGNTGYIRLNSFIDKSPAEVRAALEEFSRNPEVRNVVLDLRDNGGGLLESAVEIVGMFVPKGTEVLRTRGRDKALEKTYKTAHKPLMPDVPLAVLINGNSASASEITAGALQDLDRAVLIGERSFGKGLVQSTLQLPYSTILKVTKAKYYIPSGRLIQALDYSRRNPDGSVARTPDSLTNVYRTRAGREVRDGGGLTPDITIEPQKMPGLVYDLLRDNRIFDFATKYYAANPDLPAPGEFTVTDEIYGQFKNSIDPENFKYDHTCAEMVKNLREGVKIEGYESDEVKAALDSLERLLTPTLDADLDSKRDVIADYLAEEILSRRYYSKGQIQYALRNDKDFLKAVEILSDPAAYRRLLTAPSSR